MLTAIDAMACTVTLRALRVKRFLEGYKPEEPAEGTPLLASLVSFARDRPCGPTPHVWRRFSRPPRNHGFLGFRRPKSLRRT